MPTYVFSCDECKEEKEIVKGMSDPDPEQCPDCGGSIKRVYGAVGIQFKGKGFYKTGG